MKAISLWQPWASAMAMSLKLNETRSWQAQYRGPIAIHAAKRRPTDQDFKMFEFILKRFGREYDWLNDLPLGQIVCVTELYDCISTNKVLLAPSISDIEFHLGDYSPGRYFWKTENLRRLKNPIPFKGKQGFFNIPDKLLTEESLYE